MRPTGVPVAALLVSALLVIQVSGVEDLYWEGEEDASNEFLEVKQVDNSLSAHLTRLKRGLFDAFNIFGSSTTTTEAPTPAPETTDDPDADPEGPEDDHGSGAPARFDEPGEKTLRVTFVVMEPYHPAYSNRDSPEFLNFSRNIGEAVDQLYRSIPGEQKASLVRIQSRVSDEFSCKVTLDIVTTNFDDLNTIGKILRDHIKNRRELGVGAKSVKVSDADFATMDINPSLDTPDVTCDESEIVCQDKTCVPGSSRCDGINDCIDGSDEFGCMLDFDQTAQYTEGTTPSSWSSNCAPYYCEDYRDIVICMDQKCDNKQDCPNGDDERDCEEAEESDIPTTAPPEVAETDSPQNCPEGEFPCDVTRCVSFNLRCDKKQDCFDGTDEYGCQPETCGEDDFRCPSNGKCIEASRVCNAVKDCPNLEDEQNCVCRSDEFQCVSDKSCIEGRKRCDGTSHCKDGSDERDCTCSTDQWQCDYGNCIKRSMRCDGRVDCPTDRSDERNCMDVGKFKCKTGQLIPDYQRCNRHYDCPVGDYSDEQNCPCGDGDFKCDNGNCIPASKHCDRTHDCQDGSDERDCTYGTVCMAFQYKCTSGQCVPAEAKCNGTRECIDSSDEHNCPCKRGQFSCRDGSCINLALRCNGHRDCHPAGEDEFNCASPNACPADSFTCNPGSSVPCARRCDDHIECDGGEDEDDCEACSHSCDGICLEEQKICNGIPDCSDGSDEFSCDHCDGLDDFRCKSGECINAKQRCNGIYECSDESDELDCQQTMTSRPEVCSVDEFRCNDGNCINIDFHCDGRTDCLDNSDEENCPWYIARPSRSPAPPACLDSEFTCYDGRCITHLRRCDNIYDCMDFSDEQNCYNSGCAENQWQCETGACIPVTSYCDGVPDCRDASDELSCPTTRPWVTTTPINFPQLPGESSTAGYPNGDYDRFSGNRPDDPYNRPGQGAGYDNRRPDDPYNRPGQGGGSDRNRPDDPYNRPEQGAGFDDRRPDDPYNRPGQSGGSDNNRPEDPYNRPGQGAGFADRRPDDPYNRPGQGASFDDRRPDDPYNRPGQGGGSDSNRPEDPYNRPGQGAGFDDRRPDDPYNRPGQGSGSDSNRPDDPYNRPGQGAGFDDRRSNDPYNRPGQGGGSDSNRPDDPYNRPGQGGGFDGNRPDDPYSRPGEGAGYDSNRPDDPYNRPEQGGGYDDNLPDDPYNRPGQAGGDFETNSLDNNRPGNGDNDLYGSGSQGGSSDRNRAGADNGYDSDRNNFYRPTQAPASRYPDGCNRNEWRCENGPCIDSHRRCDGHIDCPLDSSDEFDCPAGSPAALNLKTYPSQQTVRNAGYGGDVVFQCRDEGPLRAAVRWVREGSRPLKSGSVDKDGRLEMNQVTMADSGVYICQAYKYVGQPNSELRVVLNVDASPATVRPPQESCRPDEATCANGQCIAKSAVCNGAFDCSDRSDEDSCHVNGKCEPNQFKCDNNMCVLKTWMCDYDDDCGDGSDERNCGTSAPGQCKPTEFTCSSGDQCVPKSFHCDGQSDCFDRSDEIGCAPVYVTRPPQPSNVNLNAGDTLTLNCSATGTPTPMISWRRNWGDVPEVCTSENIQSNGQVIGVLVCPDMQPEYNGAYSCEAINNKGTIFAVPDAIVFVNKTSPCPVGYFNSEARSEGECIRCFCFGESTSCRSADLFTYNMPTPLGEGGTRLVGVKNSGNGDVQLDTSAVINQYYYQPLRNGATVTKLQIGSSRGSSSALPYVTLPETYNGNQLTSYGGHIKYRLSPHLPPIYGSDGLPDIIIKGKYQNLFHSNRGSPSEVDARLVPGDWLKPASRGLVQASREDIMMALDNIEMILLRASVSNAGVNITNFVMESAHHINSGLGAANLVEECSCPAGYEGLSCQKCASGYAREQSGRWLGDCVPERPQCPPGTYGDPASGYACRPCPCPLTNRENQFARTCSIGPDGNVGCDCNPGYEGRNCEYCAEGYMGNPLVVGDSCKPKPRDNCDPIGTSHVRLPDECECKDNVQGRYCNQCKNESFYLSNDFRGGCALCFCMGVSQRCMSSNLRRKTINVRFNTPDIVNQVKVYSSTPLGAAAAVRYNAPVETNLTASFARNELVLSNYDRNRPAIYYWSLPISFAGDKVTSYGGQLRYTLRNVPVPGYNQKNNAADVQLVSENHLTFHYFGEFVPSFDGTLEASVQFLEKGWQRPDGKGISREHFLLALADVKAILVKASYTTNSQLASLVGASIDVAEENGDGPAALHVEQCVCPKEYIGTSCEDCAPGYTRLESGLYLEHCGPCNCNGHSSMCHPETGVCYNCQDNTAGDNCEECKAGYVQDAYGNCVPEHADPICNCDPRGTAGDCDPRGYCACKENVEGRNCDTCRPGTFGLDGDNPAGCAPCYCSGVTADCHEASSQYIRIPMAAAVFGPGNGGYTIMDINAQRVISDQFVAMPTASELMYVFQFPPDEELYWSLPVFPGNRVLSYGGALQLTQRFQSNSNEVSEPGTDVVLVGDDKSIYWSNPDPISSGQGLAYKVPLTEKGWFLLNYGTPASRSDFLSVLKNLRRVLVRATLVRNIGSTSIADVSMDTATEMYDPASPRATGVEICMCPEGYSGTSCESCTSGFFKDRYGCQRCNCNGHDCVLSSDDQVVCNCRPPYTGSDCSVLGESQKGDNATTRPPPPQPSVSVQITSPTIKIQDIGSSVNFTCQARSPMSSYLPITWSKEDGYLPQGRTQVDDRRGMLIITNLQTSDSGKYICQTIDGIATATAYAILRVPSNDMTQPSVEIRPPINDYFEGERIQLQCVARGNPAPTINWQRSNGRPLPQYAVVENTMFIIENAREEDSGEYRCRVSNALGSADRTAVVNVRARPSQQPRDKLTVSQASPTISEGQNTRVVCTGTANIPPGTIDWVRRDGEMQSNVRSVNGVLYIDFARLDNQGVYICQTPTINVEPALIMVTVIPQGTPAPDQVSNVTVSKSVLKIPTGGIGTVDCNPIGFPAPFIRWRRYQGKFGDGTSQRQNTLIITNAREDDGGYYLCEGMVNGQSVANMYTYVEIEKREEPKIVITPENEYAVTLGSPFEFRCTVLAGVPEPLVTWSRAGGRPLSALAQIQPNNILHFERIDVNDEGEYSCTATNLAGAATASSTIKVHSAPEVIVQPNYVQAVEGDPVSVDCKANGYPRPMVSIKSGSERRELVPPSPGSAVLRISSVSYRDAGSYICSATSPAGSIEEHFVIDVETRGDGGFGIDDGSGEDMDPSYDPYPVDERPKDLPVIEGKDVVINCTDLQNMNIQWSREDRRPLQPNAEQRDNTLIIRNANKQDSGHYVCNVLDAYTGELTKSITTSLVVMTPPSIKLQPATQTVHPGESPTVKCLVYGDEITSIEWHPLPGHQRSRRVETRGPTLIFHQIEVEDAGKYECFASSPVGNAKATAEVIVSENTDRAPSESHDNEQRAHVGAAVQLSCNVPMSANFELTWTKDGRPLPRTVVQRRDGSLYIRHVQKSDTGHYVCNIQDRYGRRTSNYINLHIDGDEDCKATDFRCYDNSGCVHVNLLCDGVRDCDDNSDEENCILPEKRLRNRDAESRSAGAAEPQSIVSIDQPRRAFRVGDNVNVLCRAKSLSDRISWERYGTRQFVVSRTYGDGALLIVNNVQESDAGRYRCTGIDPYGHSSYEDFNLEVVPGNPAAWPSNASDKLQQYTVRQGESIDLPCSHNLEEPYSVEWRREYTPLQPEVRAYEPTLHLERITEADAGTYVCRVSNSRTSVETRAVLRVAGVVPRFDGGGWISLPTLQDAYSQFDIEISFKPIDRNGIILYNSEKADGSGDYLALVLVDGVPEFQLDAGGGPLFVSGDRPLQLNTWHTIRISKTNSKVIMDVDNNGPASVDATNWDLLELRTPLYIGGVPDYDHLPPPLAENRATGFVGCVSMLVLGNQEKNIMLDRLEHSSVLECDSCNPNLCNENGVCQEARNERGYVCLCAAGYAGLNCDRTGEACKPGLCGPGKCTDTADGYKCACPVTYTGKNCDVKQSIEYPAFTGSAFLAIKPPIAPRYFRMRMKVKAASPVTDGIIMYSAESARGYGGFTALTVHNGRLEFIYDLGDGTDPVVLTSNRTLPANEWTDVHIVRVGAKVTLTVNMNYNYNGSLSSTKTVNFETPMFVGGADDSIILNKKTGVTGGFHGCIKDVLVFGNAVDIVGSSIQSANVQECSNYDRGDIPEAESICSQCRNGGQCTEDGSSCECPDGFTGQYCETRIPPVARRRPTSDPCALQPCRNGGTCRRNLANQMNYTCDCRLGYAGTTCQMNLELRQSVAFNGNGYIELPASKLRYDGISREPVLLAIAFYTGSDGVLLYQREVSAPVNAGDFLLIRIEQGFVVMEWNLGAGLSTVSIDDVIVTDSARHSVIAKLMDDGSVSLTVDSSSKNATSTGFSNVMNADSNIYVGGIPDSLNINQYPGLNGCVEQIELMGGDRGIDLGREAVAGRNTQRCRNPGS